jgi:hypothetical protein
MTRSGDCRQWVTLTSWSRPLGNMRPTPASEPAVREAGIMYETALRAIEDCRRRSPEPSTPYGNAGKARNVCVGLGYLQVMLTNR